MFIKNKYTKIYYRIIDRAKSRTLDKDVYTEKHHITPKSLGGSNDNENIAILTLKEHFICHRLLPKMTSGKNKAKMWHAAWRMATVINKRKDKFKITATVYEKLRIEFINQIKGKPTWNKGIPRTKKDKQKMREGIAKNNPNGRRSPRKGVTLSESQKRKQSKSMKGRAAWNKGLARTAEDKQKMREGIAKNNPNGRIPWNKGISRIWINDGNDQKLAELTKANQLLDNGWAKGRLR